MAGWKTWAKRLGVASLVVGALAAAPILWVEQSCVGAPNAQAAQARLPGLENEPKYRRAEGDSFLTFPEWNIVYAYRDLAAVTRRQSESGFGYWTSVSGFWSSLCAATRAASSIGAVTADQKTTNYIIALSFTAEMAIKGMWERTIGWVTTQAAGVQATVEDRQSARMLDEYASFLNQTPWYRYLFADEIKRLWTQTPFIESGAGAGQYLRKIERRLALTLEWAGKAAYAKAIGYLAGYAPADLTIKSVVADLSAADAAADSRIKILRELEPGKTLIETPRYDEFTDIARKLGARGKSFVEIAGARRILTSVLAPQGAKIEVGEARELFAFPIAAKPGWRRIGYDVDVRDLTRHIGAVERQGAMFEHAYDY
jgi:hypothetical protein